MSDETPWYRTGRGIAVVGIYAVLTLVALYLSTDPAPAEGLFFPNETATAADGAANRSVDARPSTAIPAFVYLYAFLGAMAYAFTSIVAKFQRKTEEVVKVGLRALAALPLAAGVFLLAGALGIDEAASVGGVAFLVGLYVNLTLKALGGLAERLYGGSDGEESDEPAEADSDDGAEDGDSVDGGATGDTDGTDADSADGPDDGSDEHGPPPA